MANFDTAPLAHIRCETAAKSVTSTLAEVYAGASAALDSRKQIIVFNRSPYKLFWSFNSDTDVRHCNAIKAGAYLALNLAPNIPLYMRSATAVARIIVNELA